MSTTANKIFSCEEAGTLVAGWKADGKKIVFTNGCFDILHLGHVDYLEKARELGDKLVVAINTDDSVSRLKGPKRPLTEQYARARLLAALAFVDAVVYFDEDTPLKVIEQLAPDVLVKGNDYLAENIVGADFVIGHGGRVATIQLVEGYSTTSLVDKIKKSV